MSSIFFSFESAPPGLSSPLVGEGGRAKLGRMRGAPAWHRRHSVQHPSSLSALRADPPSPTRGRRQEAALLNPPAAPSPCPSCGSGRCI
ncbi:MAG: hypothetical protein E5Y62_32775 [Mesorhizobium sp.]|nr:MAG: hypothetical protein E5Y62_32775 [Mesorhizobium sp.]